MKKIATFALVLALVLPSAAFAQSSQKGYGGDNQAVAGLQEGSGNGPSNGSGSGNAVASKTQTADTGSKLPFTGADLGVLAVAGGALIALGFGLRRLTHSPTRA